MREAGIDEYLRQKSKGEYHHEYFLNSPCTPYCSRRSCLCAPEQRRHHGGLFFLVPIGFTFAIFDCYNGSWFSFRYFNDDALEFSANATWFKLE